MRHGNQPRGQYSREDDANTVTDEDVGIAEAREKKKCAEGGEHQQVRENKEERGADIDRDHEGGPTGGRDDRQRGYVDRARHRGGAEGCRSEHKRAGGVIDDGRLQRRVRDAARPK